MENLAPFAILAFFALLAYSMCRSNGPNPELTGKMYYDGPIVVHFMMTQYKRETASKEWLEKMLSSWRVSARGKPYVRFVIEHYPEFVHRDTGLVYRSDLARFASL